jgi:hypothetical protein
VDADSPEGVDQLRLVQHTLEAHGLSSLLECSRRGGHLWHFFSLTQSAAVATAVVEGLLDPLYVSGQLPQVHEVYPDQTELGHAVRMPLGIHRRTGQRYPFLDTEGTPINLEDLSAAMAFVLAQPAIRPERLRAVAAHLGVSSQLSRTSPAASQPSVLASSSTTSAVIRWVDAQVNLLELREELAPAIDMRLAGQRYLGRCPFHEDQAPDAAGDPGTPSFSVVHNSRYGWRCLSTNCVHSDGSMRHSFRLFQELLQLHVVSAIGAALTRWAEASMTGDTP